HRQLVADPAGGGATDADHLQVLAQHRRHLDVEVVERGDPVDAMPPGDRVDAAADGSIIAVAADGVNLVDRFARPGRARERVGGEQQHRRALAFGFAQERIALEVRGNAEDRHILLNARLKGSRSWRRRSWRASLSGEPPSCAVTITVGTPAASGATWASSSTATGVRR